MAGAIAGALPGRGIHVVADSAYAGGELKKLPPQVTWTTRLRKDAALHQLPPARTGRRGRPRTRGDRLPVLAGLAATTEFTEVTVTRYGKVAGISAAAVTCLWPSVFGTRAVTVALIRERFTAGYDLALVTTDTTATPAQVIERYAARWSIEVAIEDARQVFGAGQARNRTARAVERTIPFQLACQAIATCWYAIAGHHPADAADHRARAPWYASKTQPSTADMAAKLRRVIIAARYKASRPDQPTPEENPRHPPGLGRPRRITTKVEFQLGPGDNARADRLQTQDQTRCCSDAVQPPCQVVGPGRTRMGRSASWVRSQCFRDEAQRQIARKQRQADWLHHIADVGNALHTLVVPRNQRLDDAVVPAIAEGSLEPCNSRRDATSAPQSPTGFLKRRTLGSAASSPWPHLPPTTLVLHARTLHRWSRRLARLRRDH